MSAIHPIQHTSFPKTNRSTEMNTLYEALARARMRWSRPSGHGVYQARPAREVALNAARRRDLL